MPGNRRLGDSIIAGPFFICVDEGENFRSLTDEEVDRYLRRFAEPEQISDEDVQADMGYSIFRTCTRSLDQEGPEMSL